MPPRGRNWKELTWSWAYSTGHPASDQKLEAAAYAAWPYAFMCAWVYLNDHDSAVDLMDHAVQNASKYIVRNGDPPANKLAARLKSVIRRRATQLAAKRKRELQRTIIPSKSGSGFEPLISNSATVGFLDQAANSLLWLTCAARSLLDFVTS